MPIRPGRFLPRDPRVDAPYRLTPQLMFRLGILGFLVLAAFGVLFVRLWSLQVLSGNEFLVAAQDNLSFLETKEALRGPVKDRNGRVLVDNASATAIKVTPAFLPKRGQYAELRRLTRILQVPLSDVTDQIEKHGDDRLAKVIVKEVATESEVRFLAEHRTEFPGMTIEDTSVRRYPHGDLAAHILGYVAEISDRQLEQLNGYKLGDRIGQAGVEASFDKELRGIPGIELVRRDSLGQPKARPETKQLPVPGYGLRLTLDAKLQRAAQQAVIDGINRAQADEKWYAKAGAVVALDPRDGAIRAVASYPTFDPKVFTSRRKGALDFLTNSDVAEASDFPALNRALAGRYPPGSTFKPVTALAAMQEHILSPYDSLPCTGSYTVAKQTFKNWDPGVNQMMTLPTALAQSCDTYFYQVGKEFYDLPPDRGQPLQKWARTFGFGRPTGVDVGPETSGLLPTIKWKQATFTKKTDPCCFEVDRLWKPGDSIQLAIGQNDMLASPLQMARFYALLANGGKLVQPHLVSAIEQGGGSTTGPAQGSLVLRSYRPAAQELNLDPAAIDVIRQGLYEATHSPLGTSSGVFGHFPVPIAGKTGTAEKVIDPGDGMRTEDTAWWCGWGPYESPELVVCAVIENGGFGGEVAAPAALQVFEQYFGKQASSFEVKQAD
ncbi:MAG TPA: penicillin-binding protein 2 [Gaiellaceae bacterium]|nr:penicillin-binding protein 2 [Gaiellaceae bacterium]